MKVGKEEDEEVRKKRMLSGRGRGRMTWRAQWIKRRRRKVWD